MIIDIHAHIGVLSGFEMPVTMQLEAMDKYHIDYAIVSDLLCSEKETPNQPGVDLQYILNKQAIEIMRPHKDRLGVYLYCRPNTEFGFNEAFEQLYLENRDMVKGLKIHPGMSGIAANDPRLFPYYEMAGKYGLPVLLHTQESDTSKVSFVCEMAEKFPNTNFILGHLSLGNNKDESYESMAKYPNVYGDTAFVIFRFAQAVCDRGCEDKLMFGCDSPVGGVSTYGSEFYYKEYYGNDILSKEQMDKIMFQNATKLFHLEF
jgi:predicted TIM-barrel fold metal-dependent hydrolase